ncbi:hypothetical protein [Alkalihalobacillus sp. BA299]|uniref:hypothetical protein n=1 Tax=Alkalihalobacillus sp. BA299 TaxID=2815938 RepID=UPI001ADC9F32|nr:hypothetical protein [Alkalihalobacillus sp. BA299]
MINGMIAIFYSVFIGIAIGGLMISKRLMPTQLQVFLTTVFFAFTVYLGFLVGRYFETILALRFIEILVGIVLLAIIILAFMNFHPMMGYFHKQSRVLWSILFLLFFLFGIEWKIREVSIWLHVVSVIFFYFAILLGQIIQYIVLQKTRRIEFVSYLPLVYFLIIAIIKLF